MTFAAGELIGGRYRLEELIGSGGMGEVFRARDTLLERAVALKLVDVGDPRRRDEITRTFLREARISAAIAHRNVVQILDFGTHAGAIPFIVMELLEGESLADVLGRGERLSFSWIVELIDQVLDGLAAAHDAGVVHRDLKPENIYLVRSRTGVYPKILDFGISKVMDERGSATVTTTQGHVVGTPAYMSPEQARGVKFIDQRTDLYSIGVVLYELLSGEMPFYSENPGDLMVMIVTTEAQPLETRVPGIPRALSNVVARAMHKTPGSRFENARALQEALRVASSELQQSPALTQLDAERRASTWRKRSLAATDGERVQSAMGSGPPKQPVTQGKAQRGRRHVLLGLGLGLLGAGALAVMLIVYGRSNAAPAPRFIVVQADRPEPESAPSALEPPAPSTVEATNATSSSDKPNERLETRRAEARRLESDPATRLAESFKRQKQSVVACVTQHASEAKRTPKLAVRITLEANGRVQAARVQPASVAGGSLGLCIERAVRNIQFPRQAAGLSFEVPLTAREGE